MHGENDDPREKTLRYEVHVQCKLAAAKYYSNVMTSAPFGKPQSISEISIFR